MKDAQGYSPSSLCASIRHLVQEIDRYLAVLTGPGIAEVRSGIASAQWGTLDSVAKSTNKVVSMHLDLALRHVSKSHPTLAAAIAAAAPWLNWTTYDAYPADEIGLSFAKNHAYASLISERALARTSDYAMGLFLIAPHVLYRDHSHPAPELYAPLTGPHAWRFGPKDDLRTIDAHQPVWNNPNRPHLTKVGRQPFLSIFAWTRNVSEPAVVHPAADWEALEAMRLD